MMVGRKIWDYVGIFALKGKGIGLVLACMLLNSQCRPGINILPLLSCMSEDALRAGEHSLGEDGKNDKGQDHWEEVPYVRLGLSSHSLFFHSGSRIAGSGERVPWLSAGSDLYHDWFSQLMMPDINVIYEDGKVYMVHILKRRSVGGCIMQFRLLCIPLPIGEIENITLLPMDNSPGIVDRIVWENALGRVRLGEECTLFDRVIVVDICHKMVDSHGFALPTTYILEPVLDSIQSVGSKESRIYLFCRSMSYRSLYNGCYYVNVEKCTIPDGHVPWFQGTYRCRSGDLRVKFIKAYNEDGVAASVRSMLYFVSDQGDKIFLDRVKYAESGKPSSGVYVFYDTD